MTQRGRPKSGGELKESSVRIRPALKAKLEQAAAESGLSIASELEGRLDATFTEEVPSRRETQKLVQQIALAVKDIEAHTRKQWDKDLTTWAMLRELLAFGPITDAVPHPDGAKAKDIIAAYNEILELTAEREGLLSALCAFGSLYSGAILGAKYLPIPQPREALRKEIEEREDLPPDIRTVLLQQVTRLEELDAQIAKLEQQVIEGGQPYVEARKAARDYLYRTRGMPDPLLAVPLGMDEPSSRRRGFFRD